MPRLRTGPFLVFPLTEADGAPSHPHAWRRSHRPIPSPSPPAGFCVSVLPRRASASPGSWAGEGCSEHRGSTLEVRVSRTSMERGSRHIRGLYHESHAHPRALTGRLQTDQVSNLVALTGRQVETPDTGGLPVLCLVCSLMPPEVEHNPGTCGDFSCVLPLTDLVSQQPLTAHPPSHPPILGPSLNQLRGSDGHGTRALSSSDNNRDRSRSGHRRSVNTSPTSL